MKYIRILLIAASLAGVCSFASAQKLAKQDTASVEKNTNVHSPRKATLYSAVLPGLGQVYNKKYWKLPIIYGGFVGFAIAIKWNNERYILYKQAYDDITDSDPKTISYLDIEAAKYYTLTTSTGLQNYADDLKRAKDGARRYRDMNIIFTAAFYALNIIDASVDGNFFDFDIGDDLSMVWSPETMYCLDQKMIGAHCRITF